jgi:hypothetical protein
MSVPGDSNGPPPAVEAGTRSEDDDVIEGEVVEDAPSAEETTAAQK